MKLSVSQMSLFYKMKNVCLVVLQITVLIKSRTFEITTKSVVCVFQFIYFPKGSFSFDKKHYIMASDIIFMVRKKGLVFFGWIEAIVFLTSPDI